MSSANSSQIFLASSAELITERDQLEIAIARFNDRLPPDAPRFKIVRWEYHEAQLRENGSQNHYNELLTQCEIFLFIYHGKVGMYSRQEFESAWAAMVATARPTIFVYHKTTPLNPETQRERDVQGVKDFEDRLKELQQFAVHYDNVDRLKAHFLDQLTRFLAAREVVVTQPVKGSPNSQPADAHPNLDPPGRQFLLPKIHRLLEAAYDDIALRQLIQFHFPKVHQSLGSLQGRQLVLSQLLDHARRHLQMQRLLNIVAEDQPELYAYYGEYW